MKPPDPHSDDTTAGTAAPGLPHAYTGPVSGLHHEYIGITNDRLNIGVSNDDWFIHSGSGDDAIEVHGGTNVLDGGTGSNFLTGGTGRPVPLSLLPGFFSGPSARKRAATDISVQV